MDDPYPAIRWAGDHLELLDQRQLPHSISYVGLHDATAVAEAIRQMVVRGAPAIGIAAAYGAALAAAACKPMPDTPAYWWRAMEPALAQLAAARPTAVNLFWALDRVRAELRIAADNMPHRLQALAAAMHAQDAADNRVLGANGAAILPAGVSVYTHCNAGALATGGYGTALGVIRAAAEQGKIASVTAGETRPWLQGARLTAWELKQAGLPVQLCTEGAAGSLMRRGLIDWVIVGADRVAANGDVVNKIGTYNLAVLARHHGVGFMAAMPTSTIDWETPSGDTIPIEERAADEVTHFAGSLVAPQGVAAANPSFDLTPAELVDVLVTEKGVVSRPDARRLAQFRD